MLDNCMALKSLPDLSKWNTENIKNMNSIFFECSSLISLPDLSQWNTKNVSFMGTMFAESKSLNVITRFI